jgi:hypothetical protein
VAVTDVPPRVGMMARHAAIDYVLKKVSAGIVALWHGVTSLYALRRTADPLCEEPHDQATPQSLLINRVPGQGSGITPAPCPQNRT